jgi:hypothetical protein
MVAGGAAALLMLVAPISSANWTSSLSGVSPGHESRRWTDESYSQVHFIHCTESSGGSYAMSTDVKLYRVVDDDYDVGYDTKHFTECFTLGDGDETSSGSWTGLPYSYAQWDSTQGQFVGGYYFRIMKVDGFDGDIPALWVREVVQDTTLADG